MRPSSDEPEWSQWQDWRSNSSKFCYERGEEPGKNHAVRYVGNFCSEWDDQLSILGANQRIVIVCRDLSII